MDIVLNLHDRYLFTPYVYPKEGWPEDNLLRQLISLTILVNIHGVLLYFSLGILNYLFLFDKQIMKSPLFLKVNQTKRNLCFLIDSIILEPNSKRNSSFTTKYSIYEYTNSSIISFRSTWLFKTIR